MLTATDHHPTYFEMAQKIDQGRLLRIGREAFALLEGRPNIPPAKQLPHHPTYVETAQKIDQERLRNIGHEAFALLEAGRPIVPQQGSLQQVPINHQNSVTTNINHRKQVKPISATKGVMNSKDAMMMPDGLIVSDYSKKKSTAMAY